MKENRLLYDVPFAVVRHPMLSVDEWLRLTEVRVGRDMLAGDTGAVAVANSWAATRRELRALVSDPVVREALFLASPDLDSAVDQWLTAPDSERGNRTERALYRYIARMAGRATPFGLFAGTALIPRAATTSLVSSGRGDHSRVTRLDNQFLLGVCNRLSSRQEIRQRLRFEANSTLYKIGDRWHYMESLSEGLDMKYSLVGADGTPELDAVIRHAKEPVAFGELVTAIAVDGITAQEAEEYLHELIDAQILISPLGPYVTGGDSCDVTKQLNGIAEAAKECAILTEANTSLRALDRLGSGNPPQTYRALADRLVALDSRLSMSRLFQVDMMPALASSSIGDEVIQEAERAIMALQRFAVPFDPLQQFRAAFVERFEEEEVSLVEVLDPEIGIGFPGWDGNDSANPVDRAHDQAINRRDSDLIYLLDRMRRNGEQELVLSDEDVNGLPGHPPLRLIDSFALNATVVASSSSDMAGGSFRLLCRNVYGPSAAMILGRFCHLDKGLEESVRKCLQAEEAIRPDAVFAEIVHMPSGRLGNVICRPVLREYEIPFLGRSGAPKDKQISLDDLLVSVTGTKVVLRSKKLGCEVVPRCTTAHNFAGPKNLPLYQFLCWLQRSTGNVGMEWSWGRLGTLPSLPRVTRGRSILALARWNLSRKDLAATRAGDTLGVLKAIHELRARLNIPRYVNCGNSDQSFPVDLESSLGAEVFTHLSRKQHQMELFECLTSADDLLLVGPEGRFVHELIIPFTRPTTQQPPVPRRTPDADKKSFKRRFTPLGEWTYAKLYVGRGNADRVLTTLVAPLVRSAMEGGHIDRWFFVRYRDPQFHIRLRMHGNPSVLRQMVIPRLEAESQRLIDSRVMSALVYDTYVREAERYGGAEGIEPAERVFHQDSEIAIRLLTECKVNSNARHLCLLVIANAYLGAIHSERAIADLLRKQLLPIDQRRLASRRFRAMRADIERVLDGAEGLPDGLRLAVRVIAECQPELSRRVTQWNQARAQAGHSRQEGIFDFIHMATNRLMRTSDQTQEQMNMDFLKRYYESKFARMKGSDESSLVSTPDSGVVSAADLAIVP